MTIIYGTSGNDTIIHQGSDNLTAYGYGGNDYYWNTGSGNDYLYGDDGDDILTGWIGNDYLLGGYGNDYLDGGLDNDLLYGGTGSDTLIGGSGADKFYFYSWFEGIDIIKDFSYTEGDKIQISKSGFGVSSTSQFRYDNFTGGLFIQGTQLIQFAILENKPSIFYLEGFELVA
ncbi:calcium-binding protein [Scytonema sp. NUACC26]|uniref:calcium-binding protein n=1 Tax=Scytonema sp. NUACC26 TaxID=3140176 RepID=UPI0034DC4EF3